MKWPTQAAPPNRFAFRFDEWRREAFHEEVKISRITRWPRPTFVTAALGLFLILGLARAAERPNVVIFLTDDQGTLDAGCYGSNYLRTPHIDELAATGVRFTQAYAHSFCCPARAALLTGRHPQRSGVNAWLQGNMGDPEKGVNMALEEVTLAEGMKGAGYRTALFGKWHLGAHRDHGPTRQGFDEFFGIRGGFIDNHTHYFLQGDGHYDLYEGTRQVRAKGRYFPELVEERAIEFLDRNKDRPFLLYLALNTPHYPEQPLEKHLKLFEKLDEPLRTYAAFMSTTDDTVGRVVGKLEALDLRRRTIIIFMSDNGHQSYQSYDFFQVKVDGHASGFPKGHRFSSGDGPNDGGGNTGKWAGHKGTFLEGGIRVPAIISYPAKLPSGKVRKQAVTAMDWYPTLLELCGIKPPAAKLDGRSLLGVIRDGTAPSPPPALYFQWQNTGAMREGDWKLIRGPPRDGQGTLTLHNLADEQPGVRDRQEKPERSGTCWKCTCAGKRTSSRNSF